MVKYAPRKVYIRESGGKNEVAPEMLQKLDDDYQLVVQSIQEYQKSAE